MNQEQMERAINFVVQHHAQFAADIQQLKEAQVVTEQQLQQLMKTQAEGQASQAVAQASYEARFAELMKVQGETQTANAKRLAETNEAIVALVALAGRSVQDHARVEKNLAEAEERWRISINETNVCLKDLILVVERYIHSRNGKGESLGG